MKRLLLAIVILAAAVACTRTKQATNKNADRFEPKLTFGQEVIVQSGFYKGSLVTVRSAERCVEDGQGTYESDVVCYNVTLKGSSGEEMSIRNFAEREIMGL